MLLCIILPGGADARGDSKTAKYFEALRKRRLFRLAEGIGSRHLRRERVPPALRGQIALELSRTYAEHAKYTLGTEQADLWERARETVTDRLQQDADLPTRFAYRLRLQFAIVNVLEAEFLLWQSRLSAHDATLAKRAQTKAAAAADHLQALQAEFTKEYRRARSRGRRSSEEQAKATELRGILRLLEYQHAIALLNHAELLPAEADSRKSAVEAAEKVLRKLAGDPADDAIGWNSRILQVSAARLAGRDEAVASRLKAIERAKPPLTIVDRTMAERVKMFLKLAQPLVAGDTLAAYEKQRGGLPGELAYLRVKTDLELWSLARKNKKEAAAGVYLRQAADNAATAERVIGGYWGYRCRVLLASSDDDREFGGPLATAIRRAKSFHQHRKLKEAAAEYATAAALAAKERRHDVEGNMRFAMASVLLQSKRYADAATAYRTVADLSPPHSRAADAHLMWAYCLGRAYDADRTKARRLEYSQALEQHRRRFAGTPTAGEATWMLATLQEYRLQFTVALKLYLEIPASHSRGPRAQVAAARCLEGILARLRELKRPQDRKAWEVYATGRLSKMVEEFPQSPRKLNASQTEVAMRLARIQLNRAEPDYRQADELLERAYRSAPGSRQPSGKSKTKSKAAPAARQWTSLIQNVRQLRIVSLAGRGRLAEARNALKQLADAGPAEVLAILDGLMQVAPDGGGTMQRELGLVQLHAAVELDRKREALSKSEQAWLDRCLAQAYASSGQGRRAIEYYEKLLAGTPNDRALRKTTAELLLQSTDRKHLAKAKAYWRQIESAEKKGSPEWLKARYHVALSLFRLGELKECRKLLRVTRLLYPKLGGPHLRRQFEDLIGKTGA